MRSATTDRAAAAPGGRVRRRGGREQGSLSLELAVLFPVFLLLILLVVQAGLWFYARLVAIDAAQLGVDTARLRGASLAQGEAVTRDLVARAGGSLAGAAVSGSGGPVVRIEVAGRVPTVVPGLSLRVDQTAHGPREAPAPPAGAAR